MMTATEGYNGWANYETWKVNLEVFDGYDPDGQRQTAESVQEFVEEVIFSEARGRSFDLLTDWASSFIRNVDWQEIADAINEAFELTDPDTVTDDDGQDRESYSDTQDRDSYTA